MKTLPKPTLDELFTFQGYYTDGGICRVRVYWRPEQRVPVILVTELPYNNSTSITNMAEYIAYDVVKLFIPSRLERDLPAIWIEHYPPHDVIGEDSFSLVEFHTWKPRKVMLCNVWRNQIGAPTWSYLRYNDMVKIVNGEVYG